MNSLLRIELRARKIAPRSDRKFPSKIPAVIAVPVQWSKILKREKNLRVGFSLTSFRLFPDFSRVFFHQFQVCFYFQRFHEFFCSSTSFFHLRPFQIKSLRTKVVLNKEAK